MTVPDAYSTVEWRVGSRCLEVRVYPAPSHRKTYADMLGDNKHAMTALNLPAKYGVKGAAQHECAIHLQTFEGSRLEAGKTTSDDHLMQEATKWAKAHNQRGKDK